MDPISVVGVVGSILGIIDVTTRCIHTLSDLQARYSNISLKATILIGQLSTLNAALGQIKEIPDLLIPVSPSGEVSQISVDITNSLDCCSMVMALLDQQLSRIRKDHLTTRDKTGFIWHEKETTDFQSLLNNQVNALNLLLTALQCKSFIEQTILLQKPESRSTLGQMKDSASSLLWLRDSDSEITQKSTATDNVSLVNTRFAFDTDLFSSRVYCTAAMSSMASALTRKSSPALFRETAMIPSNNATGITLPVMADRRDILTPTEINIPFMADRQASTPPIGILLVIEITQTEETASEETASEETASEETASQETASQETASQETASQETASQETASQETASEETPRSRSTPNLASLIILPGHHFRATGQFSVRQARRSWEWLSTTPLDIWKARRSPDLLRLEQSSSNSKKILLLGSSKAGKSTALNVIKLLGQSPAEISRLGDFQVHVLQSVNDQIHALLGVAEQHFPAQSNDGLRPAGIREIHRSVAQRLRVLHTQPLRQAHDTLTGIQRDIRYICEYIRKHGYISQIPNPGLENGVECFLDSVHCITEPNYIPDIEDWCYTRSTGADLARYTDGISNMTFYDLGGTRSERKKWIHVFPGTTKILYFVDAGCYDQNLTEDICRNRMQEEMTLFNSVCESQSLKGREIALFFHKMDKLERKLKTSPINLWSDEFEGDPNCVDDVKNFLSVIFRQFAERHGRDISICFTTLQRPEEFSQAILSHTFSA